jgi:heme/copper-type cytochrome/quinol oxidase subunit 1
MEAQSYANHRKIVPLFHQVLFGLIVLTLIGSFVNLYQSLGDHQRLYSASLIVVILVCLALLFFFCRIFALKAQDRAIRAEENLRHFILTGKALDARLTMRQIVGLRFASDAEFAALAQKAAAENLSGDQIKRAVKNWRPDHDRA